MVTENISAKVLTIGCGWKKPKGGIAVVLNSYSRIFPEFNIIVNSNDRSNIANAMQLLYSLVTTMFNLLLCRKIKIVHIHTASNNSFRRSAMFIALAKFFRKKVVVHVHGGGFKEYYEKNKEFVKKNLVKCDTIIALTDYWKEFFFSIGFNNTIVVPNIVDEPKISNAKKKDDVIHILYLGLITIQKGIYDLLNVFIEHKSEFKGRIVLHVGGNGEVARLQDIISRNDLSDIVRFEGWVSGEKKTELLNNADIFILPSYTEGLPISILEAMSYRLPVISTPVGGIPEVITDGENGYLIRPGDEKAFYGAIDILSKSKKLRENMGDVSYRKAIPHFPGNVSAILETIYYKLLNG